MVRRVLAALASIPSVRTPLGSRQPQGSNVTYSLALDDDGVAYRRCTGQLTTGSGLHTREGLYSPPDKTATRNIADFAPLTKANLAYSTTQFGLTNDASNRKFYDSEAPSSEKQDDFPDTCFEPRWDNPRSEDLPSTRPPPPTDRRTNMPSDFPW